MSRTERQYDEVAGECLAVFTSKMKDYGAAWRVLRTSSLTDQIFIKAQRIRSIEEKGEARVNEGVRSEYVGIINYSIMALIQIEKGAAVNPDLDAEEAGKLFRKHISVARSLMGDKNHDYAEAWRDMRRSSLTDIILVKLFRIKQIEDNEGRTDVSEGVDANFLDIINYAVFALIKLNETGK